MGNENVEAAKGANVAEPVNGLRMLELASASYAKQSQEAVTGALEVRWERERQMCF